MSTAKFIINSDMELWKEFKRAERELGQIMRYVQNEGIIITTDELHEFVTRYKELTKKLEELRTEMFTNRIKLFKQDKEHDTGGL